MNRRQPAPAKDSAAIRVGDLSTLSPEYVRRIAPYVPGKPVEELAREYGLAEKDIVKLASNENPRGPSPRVRQAIADAVAGVTRYPDGNGFALKTALATRFGVEREQVVLGNGSNDILELVTQAFLRPGDEAVYSQHAFAVYPLATQARGATGIEVPAHDYGHDLEAMGKAITASTRVVFIANPNNPTGTLVQPVDLRRILRAASRTLVLVDEAYFDFSGLTILPWIRQYPNLLVARTFSKSAGLAALRLGCLFAKPEILAVMRRACTPYPVNTAALVAAEASIRDARFLRKYAREVLQSRTLLEKGLVRLGARIYPSHANFVLADFGPEAHRLVRALERKGILVRERKDFPRTGFMRISAGTRADTRRLLRAIEEIL